MDFNKRSVSVSSVVAFISASAAPSLATTILFLQSYLTYSIRFLICEL